MSNINLEKEDGVWLLTINREDKMNSLILNSHFELVEMWKDFSEDPTAKVGVITGAEKGILCWGRFKNLHYGFCHQKAE